MPTVDGENTGTQGAEPRSVVEKTLGKIHTLSHREPETLNIKDIREVRRYDRMTQDGNKIRFLRMVTYN